MRQVDAAQASVGSDQVIIFIPTLCHTQGNFLKQVIRHPWGTRDNLTHEQLKGHFYQITFSANWISRAVVVVEVNKPATPVGAPVESKMSVLSGVTGTAKFA
jgi:hypothetical protein